MDAPVGPFGTKVSVFYMIASDMVNLSVSVWIVESVVFSIKNVLVDPKRRTKGLSNRLLRIDCVTLH